jgi:hypothetical protein
MDVSGQLHASAVIRQGKSASVPTGQEPGWALEQVWTTGNEPRPSNPSLYRLSYPSSCLDTDKLKTKLNSVAFSPQANYTDRAAAAC